LKLAVCLACRHDGFTGTAFQREPTHGRIARARRRNLADEGGTVVAAFDIFISYRRKDAEQVMPLVPALRRHGLTVWLDQSEIGEFAPITDKIRQGLGESKVLLAWYSEDYPQSRPCQMELTAALLAAQREGDVRRRVLVVNPITSAAHIEPVELRDAQYASAPSNAAGYDALAERVAAHVVDVQTPLGGISPIVPPGQYGRKLTGANRFVGRLPDLWRIHSTLHAIESAIVTGTATSALVFLSGLGGMGKSLLAEEYALRFGAAFPGGIFWLRAHGNNPTHAVNVEHQTGRLAQFIAMALAFGIETRGIKPDEVEGHLRARLVLQGKPFLWIVDDLASGLDAEDVRAWLAPHPLGKTLITTQSREYAAVGTLLPLDVLRGHESVALLCSRRQPATAAERLARISHRFRSRPSSAGARRRWWRIGGTSGCDVVSRVQREPRQPRRRRTGIRLRAGRGAPFGPRPKRCVDDPPQRAFSP
jgi:hypothetical protein